MIVVKYCANRLLSGVSRTKKIRSKVLLLRCFCFPNPFSYFNGRNEMGLSFSNSCFQVIVSDLVFSLFTSMISSNESNEALVMLNELLLCLKLDLDNSKSDEFEAFGRGGGIFLIQAGKATLILCSSFKPPLVFHEFVCFFYLASKFSFIRSFHSLFLRFFKFW